jgi:hypothetical protein
MADEDETREDRETRDAPGGDLGNEGDAEVGAP